MPLISSTGRASLQQMRQPLSPCYPQPCSFWGPSRQQLWGCMENTHKLEDAGGRCSTWHLSGIHFPKYPRFVPGPVLTGAFPRGWRLNCTHSSRNSGFKPIILKDALASAFEDLALIYLSTTASREDSLQSLWSNYIRKD